jgi:hypothetical protein
VSLASRERCNPLTVSQSNSFRINTCKSVSKQMTLTPFGMNTYEKWGGGGPKSLRSNSSSLGGRSFSSDTKCLLSMGLQPLRKPFLAFPATRCAAAQELTPSGRGRLLRGSESEQLRRRAAQDHLALRAREVDLLEKLDGSFVAHVEAVVAPEHDAFCAHRADHELHNLL